MNKKNLLSGRDRELAELAEQYENAKAENRNVYMDADDLADLADWYEVRQQPDMAMEVVEYGLKLHPASFALLTEKAYLFLDYHDTDSAQEIVDDLNAKSTETKIIQAQIYILQGKDIQAREVLSTISDKESVDTMVSVAYMYVNTHHPEEALKWLEPGIGKYEDDEPFMCIVADSYYGLGRLDEAMEIYNRLIDLNPYSSSYWYGLARCYFDKQMYDKAIESCDYANLADEDFPDAYMMKGHAFFYLQNDAKALENFRKAQELGVVSASFVATFIGHTNIFDAELMVRDGDAVIRFHEGTEVGMDNIIPEEMHQQKVKVSIRPEEFIICTDADSKGMSAVVDDCVFLGLNTHYFVHLDDGTPAEVIMESEINREIPKGARIRLGVKTEKINAFTEDGSRNVVDGVRNDLEEVSG